MAALTTQPLSPTPSQTRQPPELTPGTSGTTGMIWFVASLTFLFAALLIAYAIVRRSLVVPMPALPFMFWISTFVVLVSSVFLNYATRSATMGRGVAAHRGLLTATGLGYLFLGLQGAGVVMLAQMKMPFHGISPTLYVLTYVLIGLHLLHVIGGVTYLSMASLRSEKHHYSSGETGQLHPLSIYWHYLAVVWVVVFSFLLIVN